jgi:hypothetical protein
LHPAFWIGLDGLHVQRRAHQPTVAQRDLGHRARPSLAEQSLKPSGGLVRISFRTNATWAHGMNDLIKFRCPETDMDVQTLLDKQEKDEARIYEAVICPACARLHFINTSTGKALGSKTEGD